MFGDKLIDKMAKNNAEIQRFALKGAIKTGNYADLCIVSSEPQIIAKPHGSSDYSVYENMKVSNRVVSTISRGKFVVRDGKFIKHKGQLINCR